MDALVREGWLVRPADPSEAAQSCGAADQGQSPQKCVCAINITTQLGATSDIKAFRAPGGCWRRTIVRSIRGMLISSKEFVQ